MTELSDKVTLVALRTVRYSDRHEILTAYTLERGRMSFLLNAGAGREAARRRALLMPLSVVEARIASGRRRDIPALKDISTLMPLHGIHSNPLKIEIALFVAEILLALLRDSQPDAPMFRFIVDSIERLDTLPGNRIANFPIAFLRRLTRYAGIEPDFTSWREGTIFDMLEGRFRSSVPIHGKALTPHESAVCAILGRIDYDNMHRLTLTRPQRAELTDRILAYYTLHLAPLDHIATLDIFRTL